MAFYRNIKTGAIVDLSGKITGAFWEPLHHTHYAPAKPEVKEEPKVEEEVKEEPKAEEPKKAKKPTVIKAKKKR